MNKWLRRIRGAIATGLTWAAGWAVGGLVIGASSLVLPFLPWDTFFEVFDAPLPALAIPGFFGGVIFSIVLGFAGRGRKFDELSVPQFAAWGALGGLLLSLLPAAMVGVGLASLDNEGGAMWRSVAVIAAPFILLSAISAAGSLILARRAQNREMLEARSQLGLSEGTLEEQLGANDKSPARDSYR